MSDEKQEITDVVHRQLAVSLFNQVWDYLDMPERTLEEDDFMIHAAHASRYHWGEIGSSLEFERGEWQISRVYATVGHADAARYHAERCLAICQANDIADFDIAFAYEAMARAYALAGDAGQRDAFIAKAKSAGEQIEDKDNRDYFFSELATI
jgi:hypothetical protein